MTLNKQQKEKWAIEVKRCKEDFVYFAERWCYIVLPRKPGDKRSSNLLKITLYEYQKQVIQDFENYQYNIFNKSRQMGVSVIVGLYLLWRALFNKNEVIIVVSENRNKAQEFLSKVKIAYEKLPDPIRGRLIGDSKGELEFQSGSRIVSRASTINAVRGDTPSILVIDEAAFISTSRTRRRIKQGSDLAAELYYAADAALNLGGKCIIISTPNGIGNFFERTFTRAKLKNNEFHAIELNWWQRPEYATNLRKKPGCGYPEDYTSDWLEKKIATCDDYNIQILQETFAQFLGSGKTVLSFDYLKTLVSTPPKQIALGGALRIFQDPDPKFKYVMGVDTAQGDGTDFNTVQVFNAYTKEQVAEYFSKVDNIEFVKHIVNISNLYFNPVINVESNGIGFSTANGLRSKGVNLYKVKNKVGTMMTGQMRDMIVSLYKDMPQLNLKLNSDLLIHQMHTFVWLNGRADHETGCNDDLLFAMMLAILIIDKGKTMDIGKFLYKDEKNLITKTRIEMEDLDKYMAKQNEKVRIEHKYTKALNFGLDTKYIEEYEMLFGK